MYLKTWVKQVLVSVLSFSMIFLNTNVANAGVGTWMVGNSAPKENMIMIDGKDSVTGTNATLKADVTTSQVSQWIKDGALTENLGFWINATRAYDVTISDISIDSQNSIIRWQNDAANSYCLVTTNEQDIDVRYGCKQDPEQACKDNIKAEEDWGVRNNYSQHFDFVSATKSTCVMYWKEMGRNISRSMIVKNIPVGSSEISIDKVAQKLIEAVNNPTDQNHNRAIADLQKAVDGLAKADKLDTDFDNAVKCGGSHEYNITTKTCISKPDAPVEVTNPTTSPWITNKTTAANSGVVVEGRNSVSGANATLKADVTTSQVSQWIKDGALAENLDFWTNVTKDDGSAKINVLVNSKSNTIQWQQPNSIYKLFGKYFNTMQEVCEYSAKVNGESESIRYGFKVTGKVLSIDGNNCRMQNTYSKDGHTYNYTDTATTIPAPESGEISIDKVAQKIADSFNNPADPSHDKAIADLQKAVEGLAKAGKLDTDFDNAVKCGGSHEYNITSKTCISKPDEPTTPINTTPPIAPTNVAIQKADKIITLNWGSSIDTDIAGYNIYRSPQPIERLDTATKLNPTPITANTYKDTLVQDGIYYYRITAINKLSTQSSLSNQVSSEIDTAGPQAQLSYTTNAKTNPNTGVIGQGTLNLTLKTNEALLTAPYLAVVPKGGAPITVELFQQDDTTYTGQIILTAQTLNGPATVLFSGRDKQNNRGTSIVLEKPINISTQGPNVTQISIDPSSPINNTQPATLVATFDYDKPPITPPKIAYLLSGQNRNETDITQVEKVTDLQYKAHFALPTDAGKQSLETLKFYSEAQDDLDNFSGSIQVANSFDIYQGNLPALNAPFGLTAVAKASGQVQLNWQPVEGASSYKIYRGNTTSEQTLLTTVTTNSYIDTTTDDTYTYTVTAIREKNNQTAESTTSNPASVKTITNATSAPRNLILSLTNRGVLAQWQAPMGGNPVSYNLYRSSGLRIDNIAGFKPYLTKIKDTQVIDTNPSENQSAYVVTAVDAVGNESVISNSVYLNTSLLPVKNVVIQKIEGQQPTLQWERPSTSIVGYKLAVQTNDGIVDLLDTPQTALTYTDTGYTVGDRLYRITALDTNAMKVDRDIYLPNLTTALVGDNKILKGIMNQLTLQVSNQSNKAISQAHTYIDLKLPNGEIKRHISPTFSLAPNETKMISMVVGGYDSLPTGEINTDIGTVIEDDGNTVKIGKAQRLEGSEGAFVASIQTENFMKGGVGKAKLTLENTSKVAIELVTALSSGTQPSNEMRFKLIDKDGNILAVQPIKQVLGTGVVALADGRTVVRIPPGTTFTTSDFAINIPSNTSNQVTLVLEIDNVHYHLGAEDSVSIKGKSASKDVSLVDSAYYGDITSVTPKNSYGEENVIIQGQAKDRSTGQLIPNSKLNLILNQDGFERATTVITDDTGKFNYTFVPTQTDGGIYKISLVHPAVNDRPEQQQFSINKLIAGPNPYKLDIPKNYNFAIPVSVKTLASSQFKNVQVVIKPNLQPTGSVPTGIKVTNSSTLDIGGKQTRSLPVQFVADNTAQSSGSLILSVISSDTGDKDLAQVRVDYNLSEAKPHLTSTPSMIETGLAQGDSHTETLTVKNEGLQEAVNLQYQLTNLQGGLIPNWVNIANTPKQNLSVGESQNIDISFRPPQDLQEGMYQFLLNVVGGNISPQKMNVYASVTRSGKGGVMFKASDIYTGTTDKTGNVIPGLKDATIVLQNEDVPKYVYQQGTDGYGETLFSDIPAGRYVYKIKATNHQELTGRLTLQPGITQNQPVFLEYNLITVEWNVKEISIQDKYEINLNATFETDVPAAVLVAQPTSVNLPLMRTGEVYYGEIVVTNYGLIRADNLKQQLPQSDDKFKFEFGVEVPDTLGAKQRITIPYRVIALKSLDDQINAANTSGAGCYSYGNQTNLTCSYTCANGVRTDNCGTQVHFFSYSNSTCPATSGGISLPWIGGGSGGYGGGGSGGFGGGTSSSTTVPMKGKKCVFVPRGNGDTTGGCE